MVGIYDCFGYGGSFDVPFEERYRLIKMAGFDCVMLWWSDKFGRGAGYQEDVSLAKKSRIRNREYAHSSPWTEFFVIR